MTEILLWSSGLFSGLMLVGLVGHLFRPRPRAHEIASHHLALRFLNPYRDE